MCRKENWTKVNRQQKNWPLYYGRDYERRFMTGYDRWGMPVFIDAVLLCSRTTTVISFSQGSDVIGFVWRFFFQAYLKAYFLKVPKTTNLEKFIYEKRGCKLVKERIIRSRQLTLGCVIMAKVLQSTVGVILRYQNFFFFYSFELENREYVSYESYIYS